VDFAQFDLVAVDGDVVAADDYEARAGSTVVTLKAAYLDTLAPGAHTLTVVFAESRSSDVFTVYAAGENPSAEPTAEPSNGGSDEPSGGSTGGSDQPSGGESSGSGANPSAGASAGPSAGVSGSASAGASAQPSATGSAKPSASVTGGASSGAKASASAQPGGALVNTGGPSSAGLVVGLFALLAGLGLIALGGRKRHPK
jgi:cobalamin biosynthesis Mg chelatase CobN